MAESESDKRRITLELSADLLSWIDEMKSQLGYRNRGRIVEELLRELQPQSGSSDDSESYDSDTETRETGDSENEAQPSSYERPDAVITAGEPERAIDNGSSLDETTALVLIGHELVSLRNQGSDQADSSETRDLAGGARTRAGGQRPDAEPRGGIQLPGFVRRQASAVKRSLSATPEAPADERVLALVSASEIEEAIHRCTQQWLEVYGQPANDNVLDAALGWLARDLWPLSDHSDGRPFSWGLAQQVILSIAPAWFAGEPTFERVITAAGILEDPFGGSTLAMRVPTLITRFVQRQRSRQKRTTSFEAIDQAMSVHGALRLLQLPTVADRPYTLKEIREAYREQAQSHHPDAGGSADAMRRLNEAYQFLKERYRRAA